MRKVQKFNIEGNILDKTRQAGLWSDGQPIRLHLGCGQHHIDGYINIDYPPYEHTVQSAPKADVFTDITTLSFLQCTVNEIRSHHVFEHFDRSTALALLCKWHEWLSIEGLLIIETPDFAGSIQLLDSQSVSYEEKQGILRHIFGSHEAKWAFHFDGWYEEKFRHVLTALGFENLRFEFGSWLMTRNITVCAEKKKNIDISLNIEAAKNLLRCSMIDKTQSEELKWELWCKNLETSLNRMNQPVSNY